jgi:hypothetical protein
VTREESNRCDLGIVAVLLHPWPTEIFASSEWQRSHLYPDDEQRFAVLHGLRGFSFGITRVAHEPSLKPPTCKKQWA